MRTTLTIDDDLLQEAERIASERAMPIDQVISELLRRALNTAFTARADNQFPTFRVTPNAKPVTSEDVRSAENEE